ncbi:MAG: methylenetetrahydrofolate reductase, partial [Alphaproteobacteria bacterium]|nr:methylenetetrahydrofolate reductase [Alphaproteobacteria bacterium]
VGDHPEAKPVFDLDSITLLETIRGMCEEGRFLSGREITALPRVFRGAAANPFVPPFEQRPLRLAKKIAAGAQFVQTQYCYDAPVLERYMASVRELGLHEKCYIIPGVGPLTSASAARWIRSKVPGVHIPDTVISRLESASDQKAEGRRICIELIQQISEIAGVAGIHMMAYRQEEAVTEIVMESGILARRRPKRARSAVKAG